MDTAVAPNDTGEFGDDHIVIGPAAPSRSRRLRRDHPHPVSTTRPNWKALTTRTITSNAVTSTELTDLVGAGGALVESHGDTIPIIGINVYDAPTGSEYMSQITLIFHNTGGDSNFQDTDLATLANDATGGIQLYRDNGSADGVFDASDQLVALNGSQTFSPLNASADTYTVTIIPFSSSETDLPPDNATAGNVGPDFFIVLMTSGSIEYLTISTEIPANGSIIGWPDSRYDRDRDRRRPIPTIISDVATATVDVSKGRMRDLRHPRPHRTATGTT